MMMMVLMAALAAAAELPDTLARPAEAVARPAQAVLLGVAAAGGRLVAVGERGLITISDDQAANWRQVPVPVSVSLTALSFPTPRRGWAVGHRGVVLASRDGGSSWTVQLDGQRFAALANNEALVRDGADKPFLDVSFADERHGLAVGAYGLCARTEDGGASWVSCMGQLPNPRGAHLYAIARSGQTVYIAGEQGLLLRSDDGAAQAAEQQLA
ncbi:YCF48-related protein, partial [Pelomonas sp. KK5]|uniref:WD40/YVTN/BNR-like repeat-containing protein n=1 Tax=Pelomonas sp. KK5 TaxID=1855730 RepID=UPI001E5B9B2F